MSDVIDEVFRLFSERGSEAYIGEQVTQQEHALQAAAAAERQGAPSRLIASALLHDVGHLLHDLPDDFSDQGIDDRHEALGQKWLESHFPPEVVAPVAMHVAAKRYLVAVEPEYRAGLSPASIASLENQGGAFTEEEVAEFRGQPHWEDAALLRRWDDQAKVVGLETPPLEHFRPHLEAALGRAGAGHG